MPQPYPPVTDATATQLLHELGDMVSRYGAARYDSGVAIYKRGVSGAEMLTRHDEAGRCYAKILDLADAYAAAVAREATL